MAVGRIDISAELVGLAELQKDIGRVFGERSSPQVLKAALQKAIQPAEAALKEITPLGPTGNLRRAIKAKFVTYRDSGTAVAVLGFRRAARGASESAAGGKVRVGPDRARHQYWLEEGTDARQINKPADKPYTRKAHKRTMKSGLVAQIQAHSVARQGGYIASSFNSLGGWDSPGFEQTPRPPRGQKGHRVQTRPGYPNAFFKKSSTPITIPPMPAGGSSGQPPLQTAWDRTKSTVAEILQRELRISLERAISTLSRSATGGVD
jgi:hypothetical protein